MLILALAVASALQPLYSDEASASSFLKSSWNAYEENYHPNYLLDDDRKTAWVEGVDGDGEGQSFTVVLSPLKSARKLRLVVHNGYQKSAALLKANAAPKDVTVVVRGPGGETTGTAKATLKKAMGKQTVDVTVRGGVGSVTVTIDSVHKGTVYKDTCVSDVAVSVDSDIPHNLQAELTKRARLKGWVKVRRDTAAYFAKLPPEFPWASTRFQRGALTPRASLTTHKLDSTPGASFEDGKVTPLPNVQRASDHLGGPLGQALDEDDRAALAELVAFAGGKTAPGGVWMSVVTNKRQPPLPDGLSAVDFEPLGSFLDAPWRSAQRSYFEAQGRAAKPENVVEVYDEGTPDEMRLNVGRVTRTNALVTRFESGSVRTVLQGVTVVTERRAVSTFTSHELLRYDEQGQLLLRATVVLEDEPMLIVAKPELFTLDRPRWENGKIAGVRRVGTHYDWATGSLRLSETTWSPHAP